MQRTLRIWLFAMALGVGACGGDASPAPPTGAPSLPPTPSSTAAPSAEPTPAASVFLPPGAVSWPSEFAVEMRGTYFSSPPFVIPFTIDIDQPGWYAGHINPVFVDLQRYDGVDVGSFPTRMLGFGWPETVRGADGPVAVDLLTPDSAIDLLVPRASLGVANRQPAVALGLDGERVDLHSVVQNNPVFGSADGDFGIQPELDARLVVLQYGDGLLMVVVLAPPGELEAAWTEVADMLASIELIGDSGP